MAKASRITILFGVVAVALVVLATVQMPNHTLLWREINNSGHAPLFGFIALAILALSWQLLHNKIASRWTHYLLAFLITASLGVASEVAQILSPRDADTYDLLLDVLGAASFLLIAATFDPVLKQGRPVSRSGSRRALRALGIILFLLAFLSPGLWAAAMVSQQQHFPVICGFESYWQTKWVHPVRAELERTPPPPGFTSSEGDYVGKFRAITGRYPKLQFIEVYSDWRGYQAFELDIFSEESRTINMAVRIDDIHHNDRFVDRFNRRLVVRPGLNHFEFPLDEIRDAPRGREMDMAHIARMYIFGVNPREPFTVYLDNIRLK